MEFRYVDYKKKYVLDAAKMMSKTWHYDKILKGIKDNTGFYKMFFKISYIESDYCELVVDENDKLVGLLMAGGTKHKLTLKSAGITIEALCRFLIGQFGKRLSALRTIPVMYKDSANLMKDSEKYDNEIKLFFVDEDTRGNGLGKKLMNRYINYCKNKGIRNIILLTDAGCNYGFYDYYGFKRINKIHSNIFAKPEIESNGYAYAYEVKE